jgi:hypothetical protein
MPAAVQAQSLELIDVVRLNIEGVPSIGYMLKMGKDTIQIYVITKVPNQQAELT